MIVARMSEKSFADSLPRRTTVVGHGVTVALVTAATLIFGSGLSRACPACGESGSADQGFDIVTALLIIGSVLVIVRHLVRRLRSASSPRSEALARPTDSHP